MIAKRSWGFNEMGATADYIQKISRDYAIYTATSRAIPSVRDGLKTVQRNALWLLRNKAAKIKTFALTGEMGAAKIHSHGEKSANDAIGLLAAPFMNNICLIDGHGAFGSRCVPKDEGIGAPRYTSVSRSKAAETFLYNDLDIVPLVDNYDGSNVQPGYFLPLVPIVLLNGVKGIAVGYSTDIQPRSLKTLVEATKAVLLDKPLPDLMPHYDKYDVAINTTKKPNQYELTGKLTIVDSSTIKVTELPPGMLIEDFRKRLIDMEEADLIHNFIDRSTKNIDVTIKMKRGSIADWTVEQAVTFLKIRKTVTERIVVLDWCGTKIRTYDTAAELVKDFTIWRLSLYTDRYEKLLADTLYELSYWLALDSLFEDGFSGRLGKFANRRAIEDDVSETVIRLLDEVKIDDGQLDRIVNLSTYRWTVEYHGVVKKTIADLMAEIDEYEAILESPDRLKGIYIKELDALKIFWK